MQDRVVCDVCEPVMGCNHKARKMKAIQLLVQEEKQKRLRASWAKYKRDMRYC